MAKIDPDALADEMTQWRRDLHAHPEFGFEEKRTAAFVAAKLREFGLDEVVEGVGVAGVVGVLRRGDARRAIALRADMDALRIAEQGTPPYRSRHPGLMHACGHDGHTAMLLGAAKQLSVEGGFSGIVRFIFQPAEEWGKGALAMLADGLMSRFPFEEVYGLHNWPGLPVGSFQTRSGPLLAAEDNFEIILRGVGGHAARPHEGREVLVAACALVVALQTIVARRLNPTDIAVVSATQLIADGARNVLPGVAHVLGDVRSFRPEVSAEIEAQIRRIGGATAALYDCSAEVAYAREFAPLINDPEMTRAALRAAADVFQASAICGDRDPLTVSEDFARFLDHAPGCFALIGNGENSAPLHNPNYDFNDAALGFGARYFTAIARQRLPAA
jgi:amidohydrolase